MTPRSLPLFVAALVPTQVVAEFPPQMKPYAEVLNRLIAASRSGDVLAFGRLVVPGVTAARDGQTAVLTFQTFADLARRCWPGYYQPRPDRLTVTWNCPEDRGIKKLESEFSFKDGKIASVVSAEVKIAAFAPPPLPSSNGVR